MRLPVWGHHHRWIERFQRLGCYRRIRKTLQSCRPAQAASWRCRSLQEPNDIAYRREPIPAVSVRPDLGERPRAAPPRPRPPDVTDEQTPWSITAASTRRNLSTVLRRQAGLFTEPPPVSTRAG